MLIFFFGHWHLIRYEDEGLSSFSMRMKIWAYQTTKFIVNLLYQYKRK